MRAFNHGALACHARFLELLADASSETGVWIKEDKDGVELVEVDGASWDLRLRCRWDGPAEMLVYELKVQT